MSADPRIPRCRDPAARCGRTRGPALALQVRAQPDAVVAPDDIIQRRIRDLRRLTLTYDKLLQLSERLKIPMAELFAEPGDGHEAAVAAGRKRMLPVLTRVRAKSVGEFGELVHHAGEEYIRVLEGRVEIHTESYDPIVLPAGESTCIDSSMGHPYVAAEGCDEGTRIEPPDEGGKLSPVAKPKQRRRAGA